MKIAKFMLLSLILFAILGAVLAFKLKTYQLEWCYTTRVLGAEPTTWDCTLYIENRRIPPGSPTIYATSLKADGQQVTIETDCVVPPEPLECVKVRLDID